MKLREVNEELDCSVLSGKNSLNRKINYIAGADLMSDVLAFVPSGALILTGLTNLQSVVTADISDAAAIVYVRGKVPDEEAVERAKQLELPLLKTDLSMYEACGKLYSKDGRTGSGRLEASL